MVENRRNEIPAIESIDWSRSFALALKSTIVGFLLGFVWVAIHTIIRYSLLRAFYYGHWFTPDFGQMLLDDSMSLFFPFIPFQPSGLSGSSIFRLFSIIFGQYFSLYDILFFILYFLFLFLVYISQLVPTMKYSSEEAGYSISWKRGYIIGIKSGIVGLILAIIFVSIGGMITLFTLASFSSGGSVPPPSEYSPSTFLGGFIAFVLILVVLLFFAEAATGASVIKFTTSEVKRGGIGWQRSFWVAIKASIVGLLWAILFAIIFGIFFGIVIIAVIGSFSASAIVAGASLVIAMLFITLVLVTLAPTASIIKYLVEELLTMPQHSEEKGERNIDNTNIMNEHVGSQVLDDKLLPSSTIKTEFSGKKECSNCALFLTANCPRNYPNDNDVWKSQKVCELFYPRNA